MTWLAAAQNSGSKSPPITTAPWSSMPGPASPIPATGTPVDRDTLFTVYSVSKGITATVVHILAERGTLAYDNPIARHWPEFAHNGKAGIHLRHALSHTAGLPQMPPGYGSYEVTDWAVMCDRIATLSPLFPPGETPVYHALTYGWIVGGVAERADGRPFARIVAEEIAAPLALDGLFFGVPASELSRVAMLVEVREPRRCDPAATAEYPTSCRTRRLLPRR